MFNDPTILDDHKDPIRKDKLKNRNNIKDNGSYEQGISNTNFELTKTLLSNKSKNQKGQNRGTNADEAEGVTNFSVYHNSLSMENLVHEAELVLNQSEGTSGSFLQKITSTRLSIFGAEKEANNKPLKCSVEGICDF
ncbi:hypothetical protein TorRG33x02_353170 [Trema orientale]|uniref:Uncharacterized protein n=1 Tax=Trema orientale TaxID=63057 RepID=A0A2P5ADC5_TREOI|nr:hypothetical protein TorRG33x02_353170 [Trema orientale]